MKNIFNTSVITLITALASTLGLQAQPGLDHEPNEIVAHRMNQQTGDAPTVGSVSATTPILYHGGPVMGTPTAYVIWYGNWNQGNGTDTPAGQQIVTDFLNSIGGSPYFSINTSYSLTATPISGNVTYGGATADAGSQGTKLSDSKVWTIVQTAINSGRLPRDNNGVYFVLTSSDVSESSGFCSRYCGWHTAGTTSGTDIKFAFIGNAARCLNGCAAQTVGPNGNAGVDGMVSVIAHELEETTTDPDLNAWYDKHGGENADKCAWTFGQSQYQVANGAWANVHLGTRDYLIQRNLFHTLSGDYCGISLVGGVLQQ